MTKIVFASIAALILLTGCDPDEPQWRNVCVRDHVEVTLMPTTFDGKTIQMMPQLYSVCDARQTVCVVPNDWKGEAKCPPIKQEEIVHEE